MTEQPTKDPCESLVKAIAEIDARHAQRTADTLSATPRTDAKAIWSAQLGDVVGMDFARQLERDLNAARLALSGIASCSTCEACRGAATLALGDSH
jgi:hypothetical protein